mmetsp:Transcript_38849/g.40273  ORF Transcript_38849/g.40273 Transcript_38849/m.40273 type:complete len:237 (-) Transcript_38849:88-798(-)
MNTNLKKSNFSNTVLDITHSAKIDDIHSLEISFIEDINKLPSNLYDEKLLKPKLSSQGNQSIQEKEGIEVLIRNEFIPWKSKGKIFYNEELNKLMDSRRDIKKKFHFLIKHIFSQEKPQGDTSSMLSHEIDGSFCAKLNRKVNNAYLASSNVVDINDGLITIRKWNEDYQEVDDITLKIENQLLMSLDDYQKIAICEELFGNIIKKREEEEQKNKWYKKLIGDYTKYLSDMNKHKY